RFPARHGHIAAAHLSRRPRSHSPGRRGSRGAGDRRHRGGLEADERRALLPVVDGRGGADVEADVLLLAMKDRLGKGTGIGLGFVQGFRLARGAIASTANAVCENIVIVGTDPTDMAVAANHLASIGGGKVVVDGAKVVAAVELPVCGLLAEDPLDEVMTK